MRERSDARASGVRERTRALGHVTARMSALTEGQTRVRSSQPAVDACDRRPQGVRANRRGQR